MSISMNSNCPKAGQLTLETFAERLTDSSRLDSTLSLYEQVNEIRLPAGGGSDIFDQQTIEIADANGSVIFEFDRDDALGVTGQNTPVVFNVDDTPSELAETLFEAIEAAGLDLNATLAGNRVRMSGPITVTKQLRRYERPQDRGHCPQRRLLQQRFLH